MSGTPHIKAEKGDFANVVLMPGDPLRAKWIAETYLHEAKLVNEVRGILAFTGLTANNKRVSVMASGMGMPSIGIYCHELYTSFGVDTIIRVGTCGAYQKNIALRDIIIGEGACTDSNWMGEHSLYGGTFSAIADYSLLAAAVEEATKRQAKVHVGNILSSETFYDYRPEAWKKWANLGVLGVEMEAYALYEQAAELGKRALAICTVSDSFLSDAILSPAERQEGLKMMIETSLGVAERFAK
jgi:purine-nucleoside phosphorylase